MEKANITGVVVTDLDRTLIKDDDDETPIKEVVKFIQALQSQGMLCVVVTARRDCFHEDVSALLERLGLQDCILWCLPLDFIGMPGLYDWDDVQRIVQYYKTATRLTVVSLLGCLGPAAAGGPVLRVAMGDMPWDVSTNNKVDVVGKGILGTHVIQVGKGSNESETPWYDDPKEMEESKKRMEEVLKDLVQEESPVLIPRQTAVQLLGNNPATHALLNAYMGALLEKGKGGNAESGGAKDCVHNGSVPTAVFRLNQATVATEHDIDAAIREEEAALREDEELADADTVVEAQWKAWLPPPAPDEEEAASQRPFYCADLEFIRVMDLAARVRKRLDRRDGPGMSDAVLRRCHAHLLGATAASTEEVVHDWYKKKLCSGKPVTRPI